MPLSQANPYWTFTLWLTFQRHRKGAIGNVARFVEQDSTWPASRDQKGLEAYLRDHNAALLPNLREAWQEYERAIAEGWEY